MANGACQNKEVPDDMIEAILAPQVKNDAQAVGQSPGQQPPQSASRNGLQ